MEGGGRRWQVRGSTFQLIADQKKSQYSPLEKRIDLIMFLVIISMLRVGAVGGVGFVIHKEGWQKMVGQEQQVPIKSLTK